MSSGKEGETALFLEPDFSPGQNKTNKTLIQMNPKNEGSVEHSTFSTDDGLRKEHSPRHPPHRIHLWVFELFYFIFLFMLLNNRARKTYRGVFDGFSHAYIYMCVYMHIHIYICIYILTTSIYTYMYILTTHTHTHIYNIYIYMVNKSLGNYRNLFWK